MGARGVVVAAAAFAAGLAVAGSARAAVRVEADEVIFSLKSAGAREVFLVGDFNQWNPTVEPMLREGDAFVVRLFLVAGTYRYQFVVDGVAMADPDNRGPSPERGSPLVLVERSGGLLLSTEIPEETGRAATTGYRARYLGFLRVDDDDGDVDQRVDLLVHTNVKPLRARALVATGDSSWTWSPADVDAFFDRGFVDVATGKLAVRGFENDSTWASTDPMGLVGRAGLYGYDAGFGYHGVTGVAAGTHTALRARWADETARGALPPSSVDAAGLASFAAGSGADTTAYAYTPTFDGSDAAALEATLDAGDFAAGCLLRRDAGVNPGVWVDIVRSATEFATRTYATREDRDVSTVWLRWDGWREARVTFGYGWGGADARAYATASDSSDLSEPLDATAALTPVDASRGILATDRYLVELSAPRWGSATLRWDYSRFDFDGLEGGSLADVHRARLGAETTTRGWRVAALATYTNQQYRDTPDALYIDWPERNVWLSRWDAMGVPSMVAIDLEEHTEWVLEAARDAARVDAGAVALLQTPGVAEAPAHASVRAYGQVAIGNGWYLFGDARWAWYDRPAWDVDESFLDGYVEAGYRRGPIWVSAGFGLDPWAFDPVIADFADLGRSEFLRQAIAGGVRRSQADAIGKELIERERALADLRLVKLECVISLQ